MQSWTRLYDSVKLANNLGAGFDGYISHLHYIHYTGNSPFNYENYFVAPSDELGFGLGYNFLSNRFTVDWSYYVPAWDPKDLDYSVFDRHALRGREHHLPRDEKRTDVRS